MSETVELVTPPKMRRVLVQRFTSLGMFGAILFVGGPLVSWIGFAQLDSLYRVEQDRAGLIMAIGGLASLASIPMMLVGRFYEISKEAAPPEADAAAQAKPRGKPLGVR